MDRVGDEQRHDDLDRHRQREQQVVAQREPEDRVVPEHAVVVEADVLRRAEMPSQRVSECTAMLANGYTTNAVTSTTAGAA